MSAISSSRSGLELTKEEIQQVSLGILKKFHHYCVEHGFRYSICYGTLIGAVRHKGFIPWDDDIDVLMPREDYEKFIATFHAPGLGLFSHRQKSSYILYSHVYDDSGETFYKTSLPFSSDCRGGVWIDVFPADFCTEDARAHKALTYKLNDLFGLQIRLRETKLSLRDMPTLKKKLGLLKRRVLRLWGLHIGMVNHRMEKMMLSHRGHPSANFDQFAAMDIPGRPYKYTEDFSSIEMMPFEDSEFCVMKGYHRFLSASYGNYMKIPPVEDRIDHKDFVHFYWR